MLMQIDSRKAYAYTGGKPFDPARPTVVFVHGAQNDHSVWILQSRYLAHHGWSVLALDLPGHGRSEGPALATVEAMARWTLDAIRAAGASCATIVGHSMGSLIAVEAAGQKPEAVTAVALVGTAFPMKVSEALLAAARDDEPKAFDMINYWSHWDVFPRPGAPGPGFSIYQQNLRLMQRQAPGVLLNDFSACNAYAGGAARAAALACPALFVLGKRDLMTPPKAARSLVAGASEAAAARGLPEPVVVEVDGGGHALMAERPDAVLGALKAFLARVAPAKLAA